MTETKTDCKGCWGEEELYYNLSVNPVQGSDTFKADVAIRLQDVLAIQQLHVIQPLFSLFGEIPVRGR